MMRMLRWSLVLWCCAGCGGPTEPARTLARATQRLGFSADQTVFAIVDGLVQAQAITVDEGQQVAVVANAEQLILSTPAAPNAQSPLAVLYVEPPDDAPKATILSSNMRFTTNAWTSFADQAGTRYRAAGRSVHVFRVAPQGGSAIDFALQMTIRNAVGTESYWINNFGKNYQIDFRSGERIEWVGGLAVSQNGLSRAPDGAQLYEGHTTQISVETYPRIPGVQALLFYTFDEYRTVKSAPMRVLMDGAGPNGNNTRWHGSLPTEGSSVGQQIRFWVQVTGPKNTLFDSQGGKNYLATVISSPPVVWGENGLYAFRKPEYRHVYQQREEEPLPCDAGNYAGGYASAPMPAIELYLPGVTDQPSAEQAGKDGFLRAEAYSPFFSGSPTGTWQSWPLEFLERSGNNLRYFWRVRKMGMGNPSTLFDPYGTSTMCPLAADYPYKLRVSSDGGKTWRWFGQSGPPWGGANRTLRFQNASRGPLVSVPGYPHFGKVPVGSQQTLRIRLRNEERDPLTLNQFAERDDHGAFTMKIVQCANWGQCEMTAQPGEEFPLDIDVTFAPSTEDPYQMLGITFSAKVSGTTACIVNQGSGEATIAGNAN